MDLSPKIESAHNASRPQTSSWLVEVFKNAEEWRHAADHPAAMGQPIEFKLLDETTRVGYRTEVSCQGRGGRVHAFGTKIVYVAESDGEDELYRPHQIVSWRNSKPFPRVRFLGVCDSDEEEHLGRVSPLFVTYIHLILSELQASGGTAVGMRFQQTRHYMDEEGRDYWETYIDVAHPTRPSQSITMRECDGDNHVVFVGPRIDDRMFSFKDLAEAANYLLNIVL